MSKPSSGTNIQERRNVIVCRCAGVTRATLTQAVAEGCKTVAELAAKTGASQACGSCTPLLAEMVGESDMEPATLLDVIPVTESVKSFRFRPQSGELVPHRPGQHMRVEAAVDGFLVQRAYTLTSPPGAHYYEITVQREEHGLMSRWLHDSLNERSRFRISPPKGQFHLTVDAETPIVCFAGGIGVTPFLAMLRHVVTHPVRRRLHIKYSVSSDEQIIYRSELLAAANHDHIRIDVHNSNEHGHLEHEDIRQVALEYPAADFYLCGSKHYETSVADSLKRTGIDNKRIHVEHFNPLAPVHHGTRNNYLLAGSSLALLLGLLFIFLPPFSAPYSVQAPDLARLWVDALWQQVTGFTVLGLSVVGLSMSLRKRVPTVRFGHFDWWRVLHIAMGVMALVALFIHTGLHLGTNVGLALVSCFLGILLLGSLNGMMALSEKHWRWPFMHRLGPSLRYLHIAVAWPLPALLGVHIAAVYYF